MTYFRRREADYHWRGHVSRSCSEREGVVPRRYGRQTKRLYDTAEAMALMLGLNGGSGKGKKKFVMGLIALE